MEWLNGRGMRLVLVGFAAAVALGSQSVKADFTFGEPVNLGPPINSSYQDADTYISSEGLEFYFSSDRPGGYGYYDLWVSSRDTNDADWSEPVNLGETVNSKAFDGAPCISPDGLELYFESRREGGLSSGSDIWVSRRVTIDDPWSEPVNLAAPVNSWGADVVPCISTDGLQLYFGSSRDGGYGVFDIYVSSRQTKDDDWGVPMNLGPVVNSSTYQWFPHISNDRRTLFFARGYPEETSQLWMTRRKTVADEWDEPVRLEAIVGDTPGDGGPYLSSDESVLYFYSNRTGGYGGWDIWQAPIIPVVDFNGDGIIDIDDLVILIENWGSDESLCDIGPTPLGDGIVDVLDLSVFIEHFKAIPPTDEIHINEKDDGGQVELETGQVLVVTLESNPTTGYRWEVDQIQTSILVQMGETEFEPFEEDKPAVGTGGWEIFRFKAVSTGQMTLNMAYRKSWEEDEPLKTFSVDVIVN